jgi:hypothetical protein
METKPELNNVIVSSDVEILENTENDNSTQKDKEIILLQILNNIHWQRFNNLCLSIGRDLNDPQWRFL